MSWKIETDRKGEKFVAITTPLNGRIVLATLDQPRSYVDPARPNSPPSAPKFSARVTFAPSDAGDLWAAICAIAEASFPPIQGISPANQVVMLSATEQLMQGKLHSPLRNGNELVSKDPGKYARYKDLFYINAGTGEKFRPMVVGMDGKTQIDPKEVWWGCRGRLFLQLKAYKTQLGAGGITAYLQAVQYGGGNRATDEIAGGGGARAISAFANAGGYTDDGFGHNAAGGQALFAPPSAFQQPPQPMAPSGYPVPPQPLQQALAASGFPAFAAPSMTPVQPPAYAMPNGNGNGNGNGFAAPPGNGGGNGYVPPPPPPPVYDHATGQWVFPQQQTNVPQGQLFAPPPGTAFPPGFQPR
jgi:hypothetical protein